MQETHTAAHTPTTSKNHFYALFSTQISYQFLSQQFTGVIPFIQARIKIQKNTKQSIKTHLKILHKNTKNSSKNTL